LKKGVIIVGGEKIDRFGSKQSIDLIMIQSKLFKKIQLKLPPTIIIFSADEYPSNPSINFDNETLF